MFNKRISRISRNFIARICRGEVARKKNCSLAEICTYFGKIKSAELVEKLVAELVEKNHRKPKTKHLKIIFSLFKYGIRRSDFTY